MSGNVYSIECFAILFIHKHKLETHIQYGHANKVEIYKCFVIHTGMSRNIYIQHGNAM